MKSYKTTVFFIALFALLAWGGLLQAQYDDIYYDPDTDGEYYDYSSNTNSGDTYAYSDDNGAYDDDSYDHYEDDYDYYYTSRIRRFHRPYQGFGYFDPVYVDRYYYDPFFTPGTTVLIYDNFYSYNRWNRWNRWNNYSYWNRYDPWYQPGFGWNSWGPRNSVFISYNNFGFGNSFYGNSFYGGGFYGGGGIYGGGYSNYYCPPSWGSGYTYNTVSVANNTYYGPRTGGSTRTSSNSRRDYTTRREPAKDVTSTPAAVSRNGNEREIVNNTGTTTRPSTQAIEDNRTTRARTYDRNNVRETTVTAPRYERNPSSTTLDRNTNTRQSAPRTYDRNRSNSSRSSGSYSPSSRSNSSRSSGSYSPSSRSNSSRSSGSYSPSSRSNSGSSSRSFSSGSNRSSSSSRSSGNSTKSSSSSRRGGN